MMIKRSKSTRELRLKRFRRGLGARIVQSRQKRGWSQATLAERLDLQRERLAKWEAGRHAPPAEVLLALSEALETTVDELLSGRKPGSQERPDKD